VLLIAASILAARKLAQFDGGKRVPAMSAIADAVRWAEEIMKAIDERWPTGDDVRFSVTTCPRNFLSRVQERSKAKKSLRTCASGIGQAVTSP